MFPHQNDHALVVDRHTIDRHTATVIVTYPCAHFLQPIVTLAVVVSSIQPLHALAQATCTSRQTPSVRERRLLLDASYLKIACRPATAMWPLTVVDESCRIDHQDSWPSSDSTICSASSWYGPFILSRPAASSSPNGLMLRSFLFLSF